MGHTDYKNFSYSLINIGIFHCGLWRLPDMLLIFFFFFKEVAKNQFKKKTMGQRGFMKFSFRTKNKKINEIYQYGFGKLFDTGLVITFQIHAQCTTLLTTGRFTVYTTHPLDIYRTSPQEHDLDVRDCGCKIWSHR